MTSSGYVVVVDDAPLIDHDGRLIVYPTRAIAVTAIEAIGSPSRAQVGELVGVTSEGCDDD